MDIQCIYIIWVDLTLYFFMGVLVSIPDIKINLIRRDGILISVNIQYDKTVRGDKTVYKCSINILDSLNILPLSLEKLGKCFGSGIIEVSP